MLPFLCFSIVYRIREIFYLTEVSYLEASYKLHSLQYQLFEEQDSSPSLLQVCLIRTVILAILSGGAQSRMKLRRNCEPLREEDIPTCHRETSHLASLSIKTILFPKFILWLCLQWSTDLGHSTVNRSCASLHYLIAPISNSQFAYALFTQNTKNASNTFTEPLHSRNFLLIIPTPEENFSVCLNIS